MSFQSQVRRFRYAESLIDLELQPSSDHVWADLEDAARREDDLDRVQTLHDVSWVLTQVEPERREAILETRDAIERLLRGTYGPYVLGLCAEMGLTLEGFVLPLAKAEPDLGMARRQKKKRITRPRVRYPPPIFAAVFAKHWVAKLLDAIPVQEVSPQRRSDRVWVGWTDECPACDDRGLIEEELDRRVEDARRRALEGALAWPAKDDDAVPEELRGRLLAFLGPLPGSEDEPPDAEPSIAWREALDTPLAGPEEKTVRDLLAAAGDDGKLPPPAAIALFGDELACKQCGRWIDLPQGARDGWLCPVVNGEGDRQTWRRVAFRG
jgi:hypothetical protein